MPYQERGDGEKVTKRAFPATFYVGTIEGVIIACLSMAAVKEREEACHYFDRQ